MKKPVFILLVMILSLLAYANECWLQPQKFYFTIREIANIRFLVGGNYEGLNWEYGPESVQQLIHYTPSGLQVDLSRQLRGKGDSLQLPLREEGTHMLIFQSANIFISLPPDQFNKHLADEGLQDVLAYRRQHNEDQLPGREYYQRNAKTIFQTGGMITDSCVNQSSLPLDIIPAENPYMVPIGTNREKPVKVRFQVLFYGKPVANALVKSWYFRGRDKLIDTIRTNRRGFITIDRHPGPNLLSCVHMERSEVDAIAQWQSYRGTLSFDYSQFFPGKTGSYPKNL